MTVRLVPKTVAKIISPGTNLPFDYVCEEAIAQGAPVAKSETTARIVEAQASDIAHMPCFGIATEAGGVGDTIKVISIGVARNVQRDEDFQFDDAVFVSVNKGKLSKTATESKGTFVQVVGRGINSSDITVSPDMTMVEIA